MMFDTLDDLDCSVELLVFAKALADGEQALHRDAIVLVRGRVDHRDRDKTCVIVQQVERFEATADEVEAARTHEAEVVEMRESLRLRLDATALPEAVLGGLKDCSRASPGNPTS